MTSWAVGLRPAWRGRVQIYARGPAAVKAAKEATRTIPVVAIDLESDPVAAGFVRGLAQPGGNITGVFLDLPELGGKQLQLLKEIIPRLPRCRSRRPSFILYQYDQRVLLDCYYARVLWLQGFGDQAKGLTEDLVDYARAKDHALSLLYALLIAACPIALYVGDLTTADHHVRLAFDLAARHAIEMWNVWAQCFEGVVLIKRGESLAGSQLLQSALERLPTPGFHHHVSLLLPELAAGLGGAGQIAEGLVVADTALARAEQAEAGWCLAELLRTKGELLLLGGAPTAVATAEACFQQALDVARRQGALSWELRAATSLARLWRGQQRVTQARKLLGPVYRRFTEGFETADLIAAKALLAGVR
jgi:ABC transporter substrate binding protein